MMAFEPDILVTSADGSEVMAMRSPIGLLVTPTRLRIYRDRYVAPPEKSIDLIGEFDVRQLFGSHSGQAGRNATFSFENDVQDWLESLASKPPGDELPPELRHAAELNIRPAIAQGIIRAGHPRSALSA